MMRLAAQDLVDLFQGLDGAGRISSLVATGPLGFSPSSIVVGGRNCFYLDVFQSEKK